MHTAAFRRLAFGSKRLVRLFPALGAGTYLALGTLWIWLSDRVGERVFATVGSLTAYQTWKGVGFVVVSAAVVYLLLYLANRALARDLAARTAARRQLEAANQELDARVQERTRALESANRALQMFTHAVAHDLSSPAGRLQGFAQALGHAVSAGDYDKVTHYAARIDANARLMQQIIDGLLQLSRAERMGLERVPVDCDALVRELLQELQVAPAVRIELAPLGIVQADSAGLRQVWTNLLSNALKYSAHAPAPVVRIAAADLAGERVFSVADNGIGFGPEEGQRLFDLFTRLPSARAFPGSGVGLMIVKRTIERQGGRVWAEGVPGRGATFWFSLPAARSACLDG
ncbi:MAG TPA: HAMP domain-containing sensor histidine kinase [Ramlibacter sp.]